MTIHETMTLLNGVTYRTEYNDADSFAELDKNLVTQAYGVCFCDGKVVMGYRGRKHTWGIIGGTIERGETYEQALVREIKEEANMEVLDYQPVGYQIVYEDDKNKKVIQLRYVCRVRPYGPFVSDPAGSIVKIALVEPSDCKKYMNWGKTGDRIIERAAEIYKNRWY